MRYTRASASDFDDWQTPGWTYSDLLPLLKKLETCYFSSGLTHGTWGPIAVSYGGESEANIVRDSKAAVKAIGYDYVQDAQDMNTGNAYSVCLFPSLSSYLLSTSSVLLLSAALRNDVK